MVGPDTIAILEDGKRWPLGVERPRSGRAALTAFEPGSLLLMYTDGLIERPGESINIGLRRLSRLLASMWCLPTSIICERLLESLVEQPADDVALLAIRPVGSHDGILAYVLPGAIENVPIARRRIDRWLIEQGIDGQDRESFVLAMSEALANAARHGSRGERRNQITVEACVTDDSLIGCVRDRGGSWVNDRENGHDPPGLGLPLIRELMDSVELTRSADVTRVVMELARRSNSPGKGSTAP
jgi:anti-sigma regulatory factor (Ser/Thr protein kinase)